MDKPIAIDLVADIIILTNYVSNVKTNESMNINELMYKQK